MFPKFIPDNTYIYIYIILNWQVYVHTERTWYWYKTYQGLYRTMAYLVQQIDLSISHLHCNIIRYVLFKRVFRQPGKTYIITAAYIIAEITLTSSAKLYSQFIFSYTIYPTAVKYGRLKRSLFLTVKFITS